MQYRSLLALSSLLFIVSGNLFPSVAQNNSNSRTIVCESTGGRAVRCPFNTNRGVELFRQLSQGTCEGNWSYGQGYVEVRNGCRAEFRQGRNNNNSGNQWQNDALNACQMSLLQRFKTISRQDINVRFSSGDRNETIVNWRIPRLGPSGTCRVNNRGNVNELTLD